MAINRYETLGVRREADAEPIRKIHQKLTRKYHPDLNPRSVNSLQECLSQGPSKRPAARCCG